MMKPSPGIPLPRPTRLSAPFWEGCRKGVLRFQRCRACDERIFIPQPACSGCLGGDLEWVDSSGRGTLYSYTIVARPQQPAFETPYAPIIVELEEGWYLLSNLVESEPEALAIGQPLEPVFVEMSDEITLPYFRPRAGE